MNADQLFHDIAETFFAFVEANPDVPVALRIDLNGVRLYLDFRPDAIPASAVVTTRLLSLQASELGV